MSRLWRSRYRVYLEPGIFILCMVFADPGTLTAQTVKLSIREALEKFESYSAQEAKSGLAPEVIGRAVLRALTSK